jgi:hypothetical protein
MSISDKVEDIISSAINDFSTKVFNPEINSIKQMISDNVVPDINALKQEVNGMASKTIPKELENLEDDINQIITLMPEMGNAGSILSDVYSQTDLFKSDDQAATIRTQLKNLIDALKTILDHRKGWSPNASLLKISEQVLDHIPAIHLSAMNKVLGAMDIEASINELNKLPKLMNDMDAFYHSTDPDQMMLAAGEPTNQDIPSTKAFVILTTLAGAIVVVEAIIDLLKLIPKIFPLSVRVGGEAGVSAGAEADAEANVNVISLSAALIDPIVAILQFIRSTLKNAQPLVKAKLEK